MLHLPIYSPRVEWFSLRRVAGRFAEAQTFFLVVCALVTKTFSKSALCT